jgi:hypothetical protein
LFTFQETHYHCNNFLFIFGLNKNKQTFKLYNMKKYIVTSLFSLFLIVGASLVLTATEVKEKEKKSGCCSSAKVEMTQTAAVEKAGCESAAEVKATKASGCTGEVKATTASNVSDCASACTGTKIQTASAPGECTKVPAGVGTQRAENTRP